jgi:hypothetical protein
MSARIAAIVAGILATLPAVAGPATAGEMRPEEAQRFVAGKLFAYSCFDGTAGAGRIFPDGSVAGTIRMQGRGPMRYAMLPAGTLKVKNNAVCASLRGLPFEPCFNLEQTDANSFRGSIRGLSFAYCTFTKRNPRTTIARAADPLPLRASIHETAGRN